MKALYTSLLVLLCWTGMQAQEHEYVPMLREDLVWVGNCDWGGIYYIKVQGDSLVDGVTYKKVYRFLANGNYPDYESAGGIHIPGFYCDGNVPAACMREDGGRVYRLFDKDRKATFGRDWDCYDTDIHYSMIFNETDTHYEALVYDFNTPDLYGFNVSTPWITCSETTVKGKTSRVYKALYYPQIGEDDYDADWLLVEGFGMLRGGRFGSDMLSPGRADDGARQSINFKTIYVRTTKGEVLLLNDKFLIDYDDADNEVFAGDPYDFSGDGKFDVEDLNAVINIIIGMKENDPEKSADLTFDSAVDIEDLNLVVNRMVSGVKPVKYSDLLKPSSE